MQATLRLNLSFKTEINCLQFKNQNARVYSFSIAYYRHKSMKLYYVCLDHNGISLFCRFSI